jgi:hypothetical protein
MNSQTQATLPGGDRAAVIAIGASAGRAQPKSFDGAYSGTLECELGGVEVFRSLLTRSSATAGPAEERGRSALMERRSRHPQ